MKRLLRAVTALGLCGASGMILLAGCDRSPSKAIVDFRRAQPAGTSGGPWVARFDEDVVTVAEVSQHLAELSPAARARFQTVEPRHEYVEGVVRFELLVREAVRRGLANEPQVVDAARREMVQLLIKKVTEEADRAIGDDEVRRSYQAHLSDFVKPKTTRLSSIRFDKGDRTEAEQVLAEAKALLPSDAAGFGRLARAHGRDEGTRQTGGDIGALSDEELSRDSGPEFTEAAARIERVGEVAAELVETASGLSVIRLEARQPAVELTFEQARPAIVQRLTNEARQARFKALLDRLGSEAHLEFDERALGAMVVDPTAPAVAPTTPAPAYQAVPGGGHTHPH
jgi:peptidyl-prolyl cis-trans isomerase C